MVMMKEIDIIGLYISLSIHSHCFLCDIFFLSMTKSNKMTNDVLFFIEKKIYIIYIYVYVYQYQSKKIHININFVIVIVYYRYNK